MRQTEGPSNAILSRIRREFSKYRKNQRGRGKGYPSKLRTAVVVALREGYPPSVVASAAGVSPEATRLWKKGAANAASRRTPQERGSTARKPIELRLADSKPNAAVTESLARVRFASGARLWVPASALTAELVAALHGTGARL
jgi:hypothetical protein